MDQTLEVERERRQQADQIVTLGPRLGFAATRSSSDERHSSCVRDGVAGEGGGYERGSKPYVGSR
jgi:hypothetical protein